MTDVQQTESTKPNKRKRAQKPKRNKRTRAQKQPPGQIEFEDAVAQGKPLVAKLKSQTKAVEGTEMKLGELADRVKPVYGEETIAVLAVKLEVAAGTLKRCRSVYRAYKG